MLNSQLSICTTQQKRFIYLKYKRLLKVSLLEDKTILIKQKILLNNINSTNTLYTNISYPNTLYPNIHKLNRKNWILYTILTPLWLITGSEALNVVLNEIKILNKEYSFIYYIVIRTNHSIYNSKALIAKINTNLDNIESEAYELIENTLRKYLDTNIVELEVKVLINKLL